MNQLINIAETTLQLLNDKGAKHSFVEVSNIDSCEFNIEANKVNLIRSTFDQSVNSKVFMDHKIGSSSDNQFNENSLIELTAKTIDTAKASIPDEANVIAENQGKHEYKNKIEDQDSDWMNSVLSDFLEESNRLFPHTIIESSVLKFNKQNKVLVSSTGSFLTSVQTNYEGFVMFTSKDGKQSSSFNYASFVKNKDQVSLMETSGLRDLLRQSSEQVKVQKIPGKFMGEIIVTPDCMEDFIRSILGYIETGHLLKKQSFLQNKLNEKVASDLFTVRSSPQNSDFANKSFWNSDGFLVSDEVYFENGVLKNYILNDYGARKLNEKRSSSTGSHLMISPGQTEFLKMIKSIKKGLLVARFSGGHPADNGDFSGIAKNSYYIENGEILFPVSEVMISGNFSQIIKNINAVSKETINFGYAKYPWIQFSDIVVS